MAWLHGTMVSLAMFVAARGVVACTPFEARVVNDVVDPLLAETLDSHLGKFLPKTVGGCDDVVAARPSLQPCKQVPGLPYTDKEMGLAYSVHHITGVNSFNFSNLSTRCDPYVSSRGNRSGWFLELEAAVGRLAVGIEAKLGFVHIAAWCGAGDKCLADERDLRVRVVTGLECLGEGVIGVMLDPEDGLWFSKRVKIVWHGIKVDLTKIAEKGIKQAIGDVKIDCKKATTGKLQTLCRYVCPKHAVDVLV